MPSGLKRYSILALISVATLLLCFGPFVSANTPVVRILVFYSTDCADCQMVLKEHVPALTAKYGEQVEIKMFDVADPVAHDLLRAFEETYAIRRGSTMVPEVFLGKVALVGLEDIRANLDRTVDVLLATGGADYPVPAQAPTPTALPTVTPPPAGGVPGAVHVMLFFSPTCPHCHRVRTEVMPKLYQKYGNKLVVREFDVTVPYYFSLELAIEQAAGMPEEERGYIPLVVVGQYLLTDANVIERGLDEIIQEYLDQGGSPWPIDEKFFVPPENFGTPAPTTSAEPASANKPLRVQMAYFMKAGCQECDRAHYEINYLKSKYPFLDVSVFDITEYAELNEWLSAKYNVPVQYRLTAPAIFVGQDYLVGKDVSTGNIEKLIQKYSQTGAEATWENWQKEAPLAASRIIERFKSFGVLTVMLAGLIDGLNPCAFATIVFFVSYLAFTGRKGRDILLVGGAFALGVFLTYLLVGVGLYQVLQRLPFLTTLGKWVYGITAALCVILAILSIVDYLAARRGRPEEMRLRLPLALRRRINALIRESASAQAIAGVAFITGFVISMIELACTGQVYLPTIVFVLGVPELRTSAFLYLVLYNVLFITPLLVVFVLAYLGTSSERMVRFVNTNTARIKLATAALFLVLAGWLIAMLL